MFMFVVLVCASKYIHTRGERRSSFWVAMEIVRRLRRRKAFDARAQNSQLAKVLNIFDIVALGIGATLGAGIYVLAGVVARDTTGPAMFISFLLSGGAVLLSAFSYAEFAARYPVSGSAYSYVYIALGEFWGFTIGWMLTSEYIIGAASVARAWTGYFDVLIGHHYSGWWNDTLPGRWGFDLVSPCALLGLTVLLCLGMKESKIVNNLITLLNLFIISFVIVAGLFFVDPGNWSDFAPYGAAGIFSGSATVFYSYIGFDTICTTAEEIKRPQRDLPLGIILSVGICGALYIGVSVVLTMMVHYTALSTDAPLAEAFSAHGQSWATYIITVGALAGLTTTMLTSILPQPRVFFAMARDGLIFRFFEHINRRFQTPVVGTVVTGVLAALMAAFLSVKELADMMSVGTLLAFTVVCCCVVFARYESEEHPWRVYGLVILFLYLTSLGSIFFATQFFPLYFTYALVGLSYLPVIAIALLPQTCLPTGSFRCPLVPFVPLLGAQFNIFMIVNLGLLTWGRLIVWCIFGYLIYFGYGIWFSKADLPPEVHEDLDAPDAKTASLVIDDYVRGGGAPSQPVYTGSAAGFSALDN